MSKTIDPFYWLSQKKFVIVHSDDSKTISYDAPEEVVKSYEKYQKLMVHMDDFKKRKDYKYFTMKKY